MIVLLEYTCHKYSLGTIKNKLSFYYGLEYFSLNFKSRAVLEFVFAVFKYSLNSFPAILNIVTSPVVRMIRYSSVQYAVYVSPLLSFNFLPLLIVF
jgi:hypothetical protein